MASELMLQSLVAAVKQRKLEPGVMIHSDPGSQLTSSDWQDFLREDCIAPSISRQGNCHDNAVSKNFSGTPNK